LTTTAPPTGYLVAITESGFGEPIPLYPGPRYGVGRSPTNRIVLRDDLCSREHAELSARGTVWVLRDLGSLNGTHVNNQKVTGEYELISGDEVRFGQSRFLFVESLDQLPAAPGLPPTGDSSAKLEIKSRLGETKYQSRRRSSTAPAEPATTELTLPSERRVQPGEAVALLYQLALDMSTAATPSELAELTANALLTATPADVAAVLALKDGRELEPIAYRTRSASPQTYHKVSQFVSSEVLSSKQAILAENVARDRHLKNRDSLNELRATSLICAPIAFEGQTLGLLHLYCTAPHHRLNPDDLELTLAAAGQLGSVWHRLRREAALAADVQSLRDRHILDSKLIGNSEAIKQLETQIARVAGTKATVLIRGESGVGKELVARAIHTSSPRRDGPFVCLNCAALTETLLESELFGHEKGAFTGATERMVGKFEAADQGTIFLDEIGEMALSTQAKLLRVLEGHPFERVGGNTPIKVDVRVVAATNRPLEDAIRAGTFRKDLFFRLQVVQLDVPPLRDRLDDVPLLAEHFLQHFIRETGRKLKGFTPAAVAKLRGYSWPGNVRELRNAIERAVALCAGPQVTDSDIRLSMLDTREPAAGYEPLSLEELEKRHILDTLAHTEWNKSKAAEILGIDRSTLDRKIKAYELKK
jgi:transcriptional regulator with GAF, ATPase, and Fis domain